MANKLLRYLCVLGLSLPLAAFAASEAQEKILSNGLKVIVKEDHRAPVVVSQVWYRAGSMDESNGATGVAHVLEHMMFKGTQSVPPGEFSKRIAAAGGRENAFTNRDHTAYFQTLEKSKLELALKLEADRMHNLVLSDQEFTKEIEVVRNERRWRTDDKPHGLVYEQFMAAAFNAHPYRWPVIGWMNDLEQMTTQDARAWYQRWYAPNNAVLVVAGDVTAEQVFKLAQKHFGPLKAKPLPLRKPQAEPVQDGTRRLTVKAPAKLPYLLMGWKAPVLRDAVKDSDPYALEMLAGVLSANAAARLPQSLVRDSRIAQDADAGYDNVQRGPGMFLIDATPSEGKTVAELEAAIRAELDKIKRDGVTEEELNRVKAQVIASKVYQRDSVFYQGMQIGEMETAGLGHRHIDTRLEKLKAVTAAAVQAAAKLYLVDEQLTVAVLDPQPLEGKQPVAQPKGLHHGG
ncbi:MAG: insulinase family protein [Hydrogenophilales bacterium]|nr:insulinase family protein [Hydrogenophilales bacterium]